MPQTLSPLLDRSVHAPNPIRWTRQQCYAMQDSGILTGRYELIEGEIISKMGQKRPHALSVIRLTTWLVGLFGGEFVQIQLPIGVPGKDRETSEPEPDATVMRRPAGDNPDETPGAEDALLVIEVSDSSLDFDRSVKAALYARAGIAEYWIIDIVSRRIIVHREPSPDGFAQATAYAEIETVVALARPEKPVQVSDLLPPLIDQI